MEKLIGIIEKKALGASGEDVENTFSTFQHLVATLKQDKEDILHLIGDKLGMLCLKAKEIVKGFEEKETLRIKQCLQDFFEKNPDTNATVLRNEMQKIIKQEIGNGFDVFRKDAERIISKNIQETIDHLLRRSSDSIHEFKTAVEILFEIPMGQFEYALDIYKNSNFYCIVQEHTTTSGNEFHFILRAFLSQPVRRKLVLYEMIAEMASNVSRDCDRTLCDLTSGICTTIEYYSQQLKELWNGLIARIEQAMQKGLERRWTRNISLKMELETLGNGTKTLGENEGELKPVECH